MTDTNRKLYEKIKLIREVEEKIREIYPTDKIKSPVHLSIGHEQIAVGVCHHLSSTDNVFGYYRSHAIYLAKGGDLCAMMAELYGKSTGCARGWGGSMHLVDTSQGINSTTAIVASSVPNAVGYAYAQKLRKTDDIVVSFFGDGATEEGVVWESVNFAALHHLPVIFVCENNGLAIHTRQEDRQAEPNISERARAFGCRTLDLTTTNVAAIANAMERVIHNTREGRGPYFVELETARWMEHVGPGEDWALGYRTAEEVAPYREQDPVKVARLTIDEYVAVDIDAEIDIWIQEAIDFAERSPFPEPEELLKYVWR